MARPPSIHPTDGELEILQVLWQDGPCSLGQVCKALRRRRSIATTTVATNLGVMLDKKIVRASKRRRAISGRPRPPAAARREAWSASWSIRSSTARPSGWWRTSWNRASWTSTTGRRFIG